MSKGVGWFLISLVELIQLFRSGWSPPHAVLSTTPCPVSTVSNPPLTTPLYTKTLRFNVYRFLVTVPDTGRVRVVTVKAYRGDLLLTAFNTRIDGAIAGTDVADIDKNRFPELYVYSTSDGSGSFGRVYAWEFFPDRKVDILPLNWHLSASQGYMGHDSLWTESASLWRKFPLYQAGDANAQPSGGYRTLRYRLQLAGTALRLVAN